MLYEVITREAAFFTARGKEISVRDLSENHKDRLVFYLKEISKALLQNDNKYTILMEKDGTFKDFCFTEINQYGNLMITKRVNSACELLDYYYSERDLKIRMKQRSQDLFRFIINLTERISKRIAVQKQELVECANRDIS